MGYGFIDSASIMNAVSALTCHSSHEEWGEWEARSVIEVTEALFLHHLLRIAPGPSPSRSAGLEAPHSTLYACYDHTCEQLGSIVEDTPRNVELQKVAEEVFRRWLIGNVEDARAAIRDTKQEKGYPNWERWAIEHAWVDHSYRLNGLFNPEMINELALVLKVQPADLRTIWSKTTDLQEVENWSQGRNLDSDFEIARDAFVAAAILRGRYHEFVAGRNQWQLMSHPIRRHVLVPLSEGTGYAIPKAVEYLGWIVANSAMEERRPEDRIRCWTENIRKTQGAYLKREILEVDNTELTQEEALDLAIETAKKLEIRVHQRSLEGQLELAIMLGALSVGTLAWIVSPWAATAVEVAVWTGGVSKPWGARAAQALKSSRRHLRELATSQAGRIVRG